jgi:hypothetical protein
MMFRYITHQVTSIKSQVSNLGAAFLQLETCNLKLAVIGGNA